MVTFQDARRDLLRAWTERLYEEYANVLFQFRVKLNVPIICVADVVGMHGQWAPQTRTLTISRLLIEKHSWDIVIEVLKHEMAHQVVSEVYGGQSFHDMAFHRACAALGVAPWARQASGALPEEIPHWQARVLSEEEERLLKRVEKLLSLAGSANEHEAALAMQRVQQLYAKYNLDRIESRRSATHVHCIICRKQKRIDAAESMIYSILADHFFVRVIYLGQYDAQDLCEYKAAELLGTHENVLMAEYVFHFLFNKVQSFWKDYRRRTGKGAKSRRSYMLGVLSGFRDKLKAPPADSSARVSSETKALIKLADTELAAYVDHRHPRLTSRQWGSGRGDHGSFAAGVADGGKITLHRGLTHQGGNRGLRLT